MPKRWVIRWYACDTLTNFYWDGYDWNSDLKSAKRYSSKKAALGVRTRLQLSIGYPERI